jgi:predicted PurR-regulated permease PerM
LPDNETIAAKTFIQAGVVALVAVAVLLVMRAAEPLFAIFGGVLFAILFNGAACWLRGKTGLPYKAALAVSIGVPIMLVGIGIWAAAPAISDQAGQLAERIPEAMRRLQENLRTWDWSSRMLEQKERIKALLPDDPNAAGLAGSFFSSTFGAAGNLVIALAVGVFLAISPHVYVDGLVSLIPVQRRVRARQILDAVASSLRSWLTAKLVAMLAIGVLTTLGLWLLGIDFAFILGVLAALLSFIPNIGPLIALIPAALIGLISGPDKLLYVVVLYAGVQLVESYVLTPFLQQSMVDLPPALTIGVQVVLGVLAGALGLIFAAPLTAVAMVVVSMWYVQDVLGDRHAGDEKAA